MVSFTLINDIDLLTEMEDTEKVNVLRRLQYALATERDLNVSLLSLINFFMGGRIPSGDDKKLRDGLRARGYDLSGSYKDNASFWRGLLSPNEYAGLLSRLPKTEEDEAEVYADADTGEYTSLANIGSVENEEHNPSHDVEDQEFSKEITPDDYHEWLRVMQLEADDREINLNNKRHFEDIAFFVLDNDPKIDIIGNDEHTKRNIVKALWSMHQTNRAKTKATLQPRPSTEENEEEKPSFAQTLGMPKRKWYDRKHKEDALSDEELRTHQDVAYREGQGAAADHYQGYLRRMPKNPYTSGSRRHQMWEKGFTDYENGIWDKVYDEDEEEHTESAYDRGYSDQMNGKGREANPYPRGTQDYDDWLAAWNDSRVFSLEQRWEEEEESVKAAQSFEIPHEQNAHGYREDGQPTGSTTPEAPTHQFLLVWRDGRTEMITGNDIVDAFTNAGYGADAVSALDHYKEVKDAQDADPNPL